MSRHVSVAAHAKLNLTLEVVGDRPDGYHELRSVFARIGLHDDVRVGPSRVLDVSVTPPVGALAGDELSARAVRALAEATGREARAHVRVRKRIPVAAGLGGGSSDAGATIRALADLWRSDGVDLAAVGARVGSDVPFFSGDAVVALVSGRGEHVRPLPAPRAAIHVVLVTLSARVSTAAIFAALPAGDRSAGEATAALARAFADGTADAAAIRALACNDLASTAERICPAIGEARALAATLGVSLALTGSGPTLFTAADDRGDALRIARALRRVDLRASCDVIAASPT